MGSAHSAVLTSFSSGFETPSDPGTSLVGSDDPSDWDFSFAFGGPGEDDRGLTSEKANSGSQSYAFNMDSGGSGGQGLVLDLPITGTILGGETFTAQMAISEAAADALTAGYVGFHFEFRDASSTLFDTFADEFEGAILRPAELTSAWQTLTVSYVASSADFTLANATTLRMVLVSSEEAVNNGLVFIDDFSFSHVGVPEPSTMAMLGLGLTLIAAVRRKRI